MNLFVFMIHTLNTYEFESNNSTICLLTSFLRVLLPSFKYFRFLSPRIAEKKAPACTNLVNLKLYTLIQLIENINI